MPVAPLTWAIHHVTVAGVTFPIARLATTLSLPDPASPSGWRTERAWYDSGAPLTVFPHYVHAVGIVWRPLGATTAWLGQACDLGEIDVWLPAPDLTSLAGPYRILAKFARSDPPSPPPVIIGAQLQLALAATLFIPPPPTDGELRIP